MFQFKGVLKISGMIHNIMKYLMKYIIKQKYNKIFKIIKIDLIYNEISKLNIFIYFDLN